MKQSELTIRERIEAGVYDNKEKYVSLTDISTCGKCSKKNSCNNKFCSECGQRLVPDGKTVDDVYKEARKTYRNGQYEAEQLFKKDALEDVGLDEYDCADRAFRYAWEQGHSCGYGEVYIHLQSIAYVITGE